MVANNVTDIERFCAEIGALLRCPSTGKYLILLVIFLSSCGQPAPTPTPEPVSITFACVNSDEAYYEQMVQEFNEQSPHITVELRPYGREAQDQVTGADADVLITWEGVLGDLYTQGDLLDLQPIIDTDQSIDLDDFHPSAIPLFSYRGNTWALPAGLDCDVMYYNRDLFDQYGVPYTQIGWTLNDFLDAAVPLRDPTFGVYGYTTTGIMGDLNYRDAVFFIYTAGGQLYDDPVEPTRTTFDDPLVIEALEWYATLYHEYDVAPTPEDARNTFRRNWPSQYVLLEGIYRSKVGMWILPFSERGGSYWPSEWMMNWSMVPLPQGSRSTTFPYGEGYGISSRTQHPDACWQWILFLTKQMPYRLIPARKSMLESAEYEQLVGSDFAAVARASMDSADLTRTAPEVSEEFESASDLFVEAVDSIVMGERTPREAMGWAQREAETQRGSE
jgi:multiple sugar transport system substrate-binding protein